MKHVVYQPLRTPQGCYIYDRSVDTIFAVPESEYTEFNNSEIVLILAIHQ